MFILGKEAKQTWHNSQMMYAIKMAAACRDYSGERLCNVMDILNQNLLRDMETYTKHVKEVTEANAKLCRDGLVNIKII